ncbi:hypothetical protein D043_2578B, partial [Vibrio parahaemolyticus EKP-021]
THK